MAESLTAADGLAIPLDPAEQQFAAAMAAPEPGEKPDYPAPPKRDKEAPHGRNADGTPKAPHGFKADGTPRVVPPGPGRGHQHGDDKPRVTKPGAKGGTPQRQPQRDAAEVKARRAEDAQTTLELLGAGLSLFAMLGSARSQARYEAARVKGDQALMKAAGEAVERSTVLQLDAAACSLNAEAVGPSLAEMAEKNSWTAALVDRLGLFNGVASVGMAVLPLVYQITANHAPREARDNLPPELMQLGVLPPSLLMEKLAAQNAVKMARMQSAILAEKQQAESELAALRGDQAGYVAAP
jgi:hypothetical protein